MGGKPKAKDYEPSAEEKVSAAVGMAENKYFKENYDPLLKKMADDVATDDTDKILRGRANADVMQTLAGNASYDKAATAASGGDEAAALTGQLGVAEAAALKVKNDTSVGVLGTARGQQADATAGMANAANLATTGLLTAAKNKATVRSAKVGALAEVGTAVLMQGAKNMGTKKARMQPDDLGPALGADGEQLFDRGTFMSPLDENTGKKVTGFGNRLGYTGYTNTNPFGG